MIEMATGTLSIPVKLPGDEREKEAAEVTEAGRKRVETMKKSVGMQRHEGVDRNESNWLDWVV